jgi:diguanylate cyclase (GGDEF)-like protein/PAS domain S-box-containing protein
VIQLRDSASGRIVERLLKRSGLSSTTAPRNQEWRAFLDATRAALSDMEQDRYLLERSFEISSSEMMELHGRLRSTAHSLSAERAGLEHSNSILAATLDSTADGILVVDSSGQITSFNGRFAEMWRIPREILETRDDARAIDFVLDQLSDPEVFVAKVQELYSRPDARSGDVLTFKDGRVFERLSLPQQIDGKIVGRVWSFRDVTEQHRLEEQLTHQAFHDPLTNLANRVLFADHVDQAIRRAGRERRHVAVIVLDLDGFKNVNDSLGHQAGDDLLSSVAERLRCHLRDMDTIARLGGDEFAVLADDLERPEACGRVGERILGLFTTPFEASSRAIAMTASVGIAVSNGQKSTATALFSDADTAMYRAKASGKNCYQLFESWMHRATVERLDLEQAFRLAIRNREVNLAYQPVVGRETGTVVDFEALARWRSPAKGSIPPNLFIPIAEETGQIIELGRMLLIDACVQARSWNDLAPGPAVGVAVNVSALQVIGGDLVRDVSSALLAADLDPALLTIEITESVLTAHSEGAVAVLEKLRRIGVKIAIDDFGTGYSSLAALAELPIDVLKIDKRFIDDVARDQRQRGLVEAVTQLARAFSLVTVAEGVERTEQVEVLSALGCDRLQGYLFSEPLSVEATIPYLERGRAAETAAEHRAVS